MQETKLTSTELIRLGAIYDKNYDRFKLSRLYIIYSRSGKFCYILGDDSYDYYSKKIKPEDEKITTVEQLKRVYNYLNIELPKVYDDFKNRDIPGMGQFKNIFDFISKYDEVNFKLLVSLRKSTLDEQGFDISGINFELYTKVLEEKFKIIKNL
jgi:hypothetical protein